METTHESGNYISATMYHYDRKHYARSHFDRRATEYLIMSSKIKEHKRSKLVAEYLSVRREVDTVEMVMYTDNLAMFSKSRVHLKRASGVLEKEAKDDGLLVNVGKTKWMKCGTGGVRQEASCF